jgi:hypothetical protein
MDAPYAQRRESTWFNAIGRLKPGVSLARARADPETVQAMLGREYPKTDAVIKPRLESLKEVATGGVRKSLWILFGSVSLLLLIACVNIAARPDARAAGAVGANRGEGAMPIGRATARLGRRVRGARGPHAPRCCGPAVP